MDVVAGVLIDHGRLWLASRVKGENAGYWEFPGGKVEPGESCFEALVRELQEELAITVTPQRRLGEISDAQLTLHFILASIPPGVVPSPREGQKVRQVALGNPCPVPLLRRDAQFFQQLIKLSL